MRFIKVLALVIGIVIIAVACGDNGGNSDGNGNPESGDFVKLSIDGGPENTFTEAFSAEIDCDPRVDWSSNQVQLFDNYIAGNWDILFDIMFISDAVGNYDITTLADGLQVVFINGGVSYMANFGTPGSNGTVNVTRSDTRIEGTFAVTAVDGGSNPVTLSGSFGVESGNSLSCQ